MRAAQDLGRLAADQTGGEHRAYLLGVGVELRLERPGLIELDGLDEGPLVVNRPRDQARADDEVGFHGRWTCTMKTPVARTASTTRSSSPRITKFGAGSPAIRSARTS